MRGIRTVSDKQRAICHKISTAGFDITCLLDTHLDEGTKHTLEKNWPGKVLFSFAISSRSGGLALLCHKSFSFLNFKADPNGRFLFVRLKIQNALLLLCFVYAHANEQRADFFTRLLGELVGFKEKDDKLFLLGDFNCVENVTLDRSPPGVKNDSSFCRLSKICDVFDMCDLWRKRFPFKQDFTYFSDHDSYRSRIDRVYVQADALGFCRNVEHIPFAHSDHRIVSFEFRAPSKPPLNRDIGWILHHSLLKDADFCDLISKFWSGWQSLKTRFTSLQAWWDKGKEKIKTFSIKYSHQKSKSNKIILRTLLKRLRNAENQGKFPIIKYLKRKIRVIETEKAKFHYLSAKLEWLENAERCTKTFFSLHAKTKSNALVNEIKDSNGDMKTETSEITEVFADFYEKLYSQDYINEVDQENFLRDIGLAKLNQTEREKSSSLFTLSEFKVALFKLPNGKSPGSDGLTTEFYKTFWDVLGNDLLEVFLSSYESGRLTKSQRTATIKCLPKKGDMTDIRNWRPISLLNVDYKILSKALSLRLFELLPTVISEEQTCSLKGRKISHNLSTVRDCVSIARENNLDACMISVDQMKAFDRVSWNFLFKILLRMNFSPEYIAWIKLLYTNISSRVKVNGTYSDSFSVERGVRQGCPLSPMLYVLFSEALTALINENPDIKGFVINTFEIKLSQFADDLTSLLIGDRSIFSLFKSLNSFERVSGALVNPLKTRAIWLGRNIGRSDSPLGLDWTSESIEILGILIGNNPGLVTHMWTQRNSSIRRTLAPWWKSNLSLTGKIAVIKQLVLPKISYLAVVFPPSKSQIASINKILEDFLWWGKRPKVSTKLLQLPVEKGGKGLPNLEVFVRSINLTWVKDIFKANAFHWPSCTFYFLNRYNGLKLCKNIFKIYLSHNCIRKAYIPYWYKFLLSSWLLLTRNERPAISSAENVREEPIFYNPLYIIRKTLPLWYSSINNHPCIVGDLYHEGTPTSPMTMVQFNVEREADLTLAQFNHFKRAIPAEWHKTIMSPIVFPEVEESPLQIYARSAKGKTSCCIKSFTCKMFYKEISFDVIAKTEKEFSKRKTWYLSRWESLRDVNWPKVLAYLNTNRVDSKTSDIIFRHIHSGIWTRIRLFKSNLEEHTLCTRCYAAPECYSHIFLDCQYSSKIWDEAQIFITAIFPEARSLNKARCIVAGYADVRQCKSVLQCLEDARIAFFKATYQQRNLSFLGKHVNGCQIFRTFFLRTVQARFETAMWKGDFKPFKPYERICNVIGNIVSFNSNLLPDKIKINFIK